jgi:hypothetical protein
LVFLQTKLLGTYLYELADVKADTKYRGVGAENHRRTRKRMEIQIKMDVYLYPALEWDKSSR